jgi:threonine dehydrogenase-like Zn-dependent dehydrogenase
MGSGGCAVVGAGPVGQLCARVLARQGRPVTVFDQDERRLDLLADTGIGASSDLDLVGRFEVLVEATGSQSALDRVLLRSPAGAVILLLGLPYERAEFRFERIVGYDKTVVGSVGSSKAEFQEAIALLPTLETGPFTRTVLPLDAFRDGWQMARERECLKVLMTP